MQISNEIVYRGVWELQDHPENDKYNSPLTVMELASLRASLMEVGIQEPLLVRTDGTVVCGHQRKRLAMELFDQVPTREVTCTDQEAIYLLVSSNEARRGQEKDLIKKALRVDMLYRSWDIKPGRKASQDDLDEDYSEEGQSVQDAHFGRHDVAKMLNLDDSSIRRLRKLLQLIPEFQQEISEGRIGLVAGNRIACLSKEKQREFLAYYHENGGDFSTKEISEAVQKIDDFMPRVERHEKRKKEKASQKIETISKGITD